MSTAHLIFAFVGYAALFAAIAFVTRAQQRRVLGGLLGASIAGVLFLVALFAGRHLGLWRATLPSTAALWPLFYLVVAVSLASIYLVTWRIARRFGHLGLAVTLLIAAVLGPARDYLISSLYPEWVTFAPGTAPVFAVSLTYVGVVGLGHAVMRLASGSALSDHLARGSREAA